MAGTKKQQQEQLRILMMGPITEEYRGSTAELVKKLNHLRSTEIVAHLQYKHHAYMAVSMLLPGVKDEFLEHAAAEERHADLLAARIQQLGGVPVFRPEEIATQAEYQHIHAEEAPTLAGMIREDLAVEREQIKAYTALIREIAFDDPTTRRVLEDILCETELHASEMRDLIAQRANIEEEG
ncbi:MAG TPA: ferritin-like domain-containing protein [Pantanalinema sp.]